MSSTHVKDGRLRPCTRCGRNISERYRGCRCRSLCVLCTPFTACPRCGRQYKKTHICQKPQRRERRVLHAVSRIQLPPNRKFATVECDFDEQHLHVADITNLHKLTARCDRRRVVTKVLTYVPWVVWGVLEAGDTETPTYAGRWCKRCYVVARKLMEGQTEMQVH